MCVTYRNILHSSEITTATGLEVGNMYIHNASGPKMFAKIQFFLKISYKYELNTMGLPIRCNSGPRKTARDGPGSPKTPTG